MSKLHPDDPRLTAYMLGELNEEDAAEVVRAASFDPAINLALREIESVQRLLHGTLAPGSTSLLPRQRQNILRAARQVDQGGKVVTLDSHRKVVEPWLIPLATAAVIALAGLILVNLPSPSRNPTADLPPVEASTTDDGRMPMEIALLPAPAPPDASDGAGYVRPAASADLAIHGAARDAAFADDRDGFLREVARRLDESPLPPAANFPKLVPRGSVLAADSPVLPLPVHSGTASLGWITHSVREEGNLPSANAVRLEEILNAFPLRPSGAAAISRGVSVSSEALPCPWKPSATLLIISLRGAADTSHELNATFEADPAAIFRYRLLGFRPVEGMPSGKLPGRLPAGKSTLIAIEIEPKLAATDLGALRWSVDGMAAPEVPVRRRSDAEPSDDARFAALVCTYAQWLAKEQAGVIDADLVAALARELRSGTLPEERSDFLNLVFQSLELPR